MQNFLTQGLETILQRHHNKNGPGFTHKDDTDKIVGKREDGYTCYANNDCYSDCCDKDYQECIADSFASRCNGSLPVWASIVLTILVVMAIIALVRICCRRRRRRLLRNSEDGEGGG
jgi:hypothetical protein